MLRSQYPSMVIGLALSLNAPAAAQADVVAVVAASSPISALDKNAIADIFLGRVNRLPDGQPAVPIDQEEGAPARNEFYAKFADKSPVQLKAHWSKVIFTGRGKPPKAMSGGIEVRTWVAANPRAIGYIDRALIDGSVRVLPQR